MKNICKYVLLLLIIISLTACKKETKEETNIQKREVSYKGTHTLTCTGTSKEKKTKTTMNSTITYDYDNSFGEPVLLSDYDRFQRNFYYYKAYYLRQTHEFILATMIRVNCEVYIIVFNSDLSIKNFRLINPDLSCYNLNVFSVFFNDGYYRLAVDEKYNDPRIIIYKVTDFRN